jgi:hypothetical protein
MPKGSPAVGRAQRGRAGDLGRAARQHQRRRDREQASATTMASPIAATVDVPRIIGGAASDR